MSSGKFVILTTPYHTVSNGQVERYHNLILQTIRCFLKKQQNKWDEKIQLLSDAIRATPNRQTGFTALFFYVWKGTQPTDPKFSLAQVNNRDRDGVEYIQDLIISQNLSHDITREI